MKKNLLRLSTLCLLAMLFAGGAYALRAVNEASQPQKRAAAEFKDFAVNLTDAESIPTTANSFGVTVADDGTYTAVAVDGESATFTVSAAKFNDAQHGWKDCVFTIPVPGAVKIELGDCQYGGQNGTIKDANGNETEIKANATKSCWSANAPHDKVVTAYYAGTEATTLTVTYNGYCPFIAVSAISASDIPSEATVTFDAANAGAEGVAPAAKKVEIGEKVKVPANTTLFAEGKTLTAWTDGTTQYKAGEEVTVNEDITLTPIFTDNAVAFADRTAETTLKWQFGEGNGTGTLNAQGKKTILVTQATIGDATIDIKMDIDATNGKINNVGRGDKWAQCIDGTIMTIPAYKGTAVSFDSYNAGTGTTIGGVEATDKAATYDGTAETLDIVTKGMDYIASVTAVYPVPAAEGSGFKNFEVDLRDDKGGILTAGETAEVSTITFGIKVGEDGSVSRTEADAANTATVITGKTGNNHGLQNFSATVPVEGAVKITMSTCSWGGAVTVKNAADETVATFTTKKGDNGSGCYKGNGKEDENIISAKYVGEATTLTISGGAYVGYFAVEAIEASSVEVAYSLGDVECQGDILPTGGTYAAGDKYTIPAKNFTLYKEGYTLTGWTDGTNTYATGEEITLSENLSLTPVFTANEVSLADRTEAVTVKFNFRRDQGAPTVAYQNTIGVWVTQVTVKDKTIDVKADFDTNNDGKFANGNWNDWAQLNGGTKFTVPSCKDATVSIEAYSALGADGKTATTIDGQSDYTSGKTISYNIAGSAETVDVVIGNDGSYYRYIQVVLPVVESQGGGEKFENVAGTISWPVGNEPSGTVSSELQAGISSATVSTGSELNVETAKYFETDMVKYTPVNSNAGNVEGVMIEYRVKPKAGVTFKPTNVSYAAVKVGTDGATYSWSYTLDGTESAITEVDAATTLRNNNDNSATAELNHSIDLTVDAAKEFTFRFYISKTANNKNICIGDVKISGILNGTVEDIAQYTLSAVASPEEGGNINIYPAGGTYDEGTTLKLTATENFGYDFVNWTDAEGNEVSTKPVYSFDIAKNETLTANFKKVNTYELKLTVDGSNDYMVVVSPQPDLVDGKWMYEENATVVLTANQYEGLVTFNNWSDGTTNSELIVNMTADTNITAVYSQADIIAGWDFYTAGSNGRKADFAAEDNDGDALNLVNTETGETSGWLDKSAANGGYESFKGAAVNWRTGSKDGDVGNWHWQTKINAEAFTDINVQFDMLYNYNAYQKYNAEYSLDGEDWTGFGSITMEGAKNAASFSQKLPAAANNQKDLYIRMIADKSSNVDGSASANDGNTLAMFFITGTPKLVDDPVAPALVSSVPAKGATGASASGKIVLTFDKKVKIADGAKGKLGDAELTPAVSGKVITFEYKGLDYATEYTFTLPANTVSNLTGATLADAITLTFTTMDRPTVAKAPYDVTVSNVDELLAAINTANTRADQNTRFRIFIKKGTYTIPLSSTMKTCNDYEVPECITFITGKNISFIGEDRDETVITNAIPADATFAGTYGTTSKYDGIGNSDVFQISSSAEGLYWQDLTVSTGMEDSRGRDIAIQDKGKKNIYKNVCLHGYQDTWTSNNDYGLYYFEGGVIRGRTDYICGKGDIYFNQVEFKQIAGGYCAVPSKPAKVGWVMKDCTINGDGDGVDGNYTLGRPWGSGTPVAVWIDTKMNVQPSAIGWSEMSGGWPARFAEYNSTTATGSTIDLSGRKKTFGDGHANNPVLTAAEAADYSDMSKMYGDWQPTLLTEQAPVVTNVQFEGTTLSWTGNNYSLLYAICKDGDVIGFTTDTSIDVSTLTTGTASSAPRRAESSEAESWSVRAANEMGGLSQAVNINGVVTGISATKPAVENRFMDGAIYTLQGVRVTNPTKGLYIINGRVVVIK